VRIIDRLVILILKRIRNIIILQIY